MEQIRLEQEAIFCLPAMNLKFWKASHQKRGTLVLRNTKGSNSDTLLRPQNEEPAHWHAAECYIMRWGARSCTMAESQLELLVSPCQRASNHTTRAGALSCSSATSSQAILPVCTISFMLVLGFFFMQYRFSPSQQQSSSAISSWGIFSQTEEEGTKFCCLCWEQLLWDSQSPKKQHNYPDSSWHLQQLSISWMLLKTQDWHTN